MRAPVDEGEVEETLEFGCSAMLGVTTATNQLVGYPVKLNAEYDDFISLSNRATA